MKLKPPNTPVLTVVIAALASLSLIGQARSESRWDGLQTSGFDTNFFDFRPTTAPTNSLQERGIETDFDTEERFVPEFQIDAFSKRISRPFTSSDRNR